MTDAAPARRTPPSHRPAAVRPRGGQRHVARPGTRPYGSRSLAPPQAIPLRPAGAGLAAKSVLDRAGALLLLVVLCPLVVFVALVVALSGPGPVIYRQRRVGRDGETFEFLKFRTMVPAADAQVQALDPCNEADGLLFKIQADPRVTAAGRWLRRLSLDELPQLWNILRGDMSLVGPRPERPSFVESFSRKYPRYVARHRVPAGLTGWAQVNGLRGDTDIADRVAFDNYYIENWSMWSDVKILLRTFGQVAGGRGR
jgi:exopolysaccharide biosynthesis polyprenyl glycosylphosphotransferase